MLRVWEVCIRKKRLGGHNESWISGNQVFALWGAVVEMQAY